MGLFISMPTVVLTDDADRMVKEIMQEVGVSVVSGLDFGTYTAQNYIRLSYATSMENLEEAIRRLGKFFGKDVA